MAPNEGICGPQLPLPLPLVLVLCVSVLRWSRVCACVGLLRDTLLPPAEEGPAITWPGLKLMLVYGVVAQARLRSWVCKCLCVCVFVCVCVCVMVATSESPSIKQAQIHTFFF